MHITLQGYQTVEANKTYARDAILSVNNKTVRAKEVLAIGRYRYPSEEEIHNNLRVAAKQILGAIAAKPAPSTNIIKLEKPQPKIVEDIEDLLEDIPLEYLATIAEGKFKADIDESKQPGRNYLEIMSGFVNPRIKGLDLRDALFESEYSLGAPYQINLLISLWKLPPLIKLKDYADSGVSHSDILITNPVRYDKQRITHLLNVVCPALSDKKRLKAVFNITEEIFGHEMFEAASQIAQETGRKI